MAKLTFTAWTDVLGQRQIWYEAIKETLFDHLALYHSRQEALEKYRRIKTEVKKLQITIEVKEAKP